MARKILLADDSVTAQNMGRKILADAGYEVLTVNNGSAALKRIAETSPDLIILDVYMPGYSGLEVCQWLKDAAETAHIPVLLSVGKLEPFKPQEARRVRADAHIVKPFEASQLLTAIARLEDQMVPSQPKGNHRFATSSAATFDEPFSKPEESRILGRGAKLSRKKEPSPVERGDGSDDDRLSNQAASFRDFRKKAKSANAGSPSTEWSEAGDAESALPEPGPLAKLPQDITTEELNALSEVAAKLTGAAPAAQSVPSSTEKADMPEEAPVGVSKTAASEEHVSATAAAEMHVAESPELVALPASAVEPDSDSAVVTNEIEIPVAQFEPASQTTASEQSSRAGSPQDEGTFSASAPMSAASFAEEPAPIDQQEEPMFASARAEETMETPASVNCVASAEVSATEERAESVAEVKQEESTSLDSSFAQAAFAESSAVESSAAEYCAVEAPISESIPTEAVPVAATTLTDESVDGGAPMPSEAELAEALRLLTPAPVHAEPEMPAESSAAIAQLPAAVTEEAVAEVKEKEQEAAIDASSGGRWVAEALALTPEESAMSLEAEMFRAFAANAEKIETLPVENPLLAIQAAVEKRIAEETAAFEPAAEAAPKAMAAVAPAGLSAPAPDETDIASIVDKVMADLRPKIVEEIARKLAGK